MTTSEAQNHDRGNRADYILGTPEGWDAFGVVRFHSVEEISQPFRFEISLARDAALGPVDIDALFDAGATLRVRTLGRFRPIHGILSEVHELERTPRTLLYRVVLVPHIYRARFRRRCRNFVDRTLKDAVTAVLENRSPANPGGHKGLRPQDGKSSPPSEDPDFASFREPQASYRWEVADESRATDPTVTPYIVQYNESDFDFLSRLLEREGLSYYFEHNDTDLVMVITDRPGQAPLFDEASRFVLRGGRRGGQAASQEVLRSCGLAKRMRSRAVIMRDYDWNRSQSQLEAIWVDREGDPEVNGHYEFPADDERNKKDPGSYPAQIRLERFGVEALLREGTSTVRALEPGRQFRLQDDDGQHEDVDLLVVRVEAFATERAPEGTVLDEEPFGFAGATGPLRPGYENRFQVLPVAKQFRPALRTPKSLIHGVQTARVTAEEHPKAGRPEINLDPHGCVRVRFPWDQRDDDDKTPSSAWIRVSQHWAGPGFGALYNPRVGHEVLVAYLQGDPERPVIVGRVYNEPNRPPYDPSQYPTRSTLKSQTAVPQDEGFNEFRFEDANTLEEIFLHAQRDFNEVVRHNHSTSVGGDQSNFVGGNQSNEVKGNRTHTVHGTETVNVKGDRTTTFESNENHTVYSQRMTTIGTDDILGIFGNQQTQVSVDRTTEIGAEDSLKIGANRKVTIGANQEAQANGHFAFKAMNGYWTLSNDFQVNSTTAGFYQKASFVVNVMGAIVSVTPGSIELSVGGAKIKMSGGRININNGAGSFIDLSGGNITMKAGSVFSRSDGTTTVSAGGDMFLVGANINATGGIIKLNG